MASLEGSIYACVKSEIFVLSYNMAVNMSGIVAFLCIIYAQTVFSLYFHMGETEKKCFIEEIPDETMVTG